MGRAGAGPETERKSSYVVDHLTDSDLRSGKVALLVFLPDAIESQLVASIEQWLRQQTSCVPIACQWFTHDEETLARFYADVVDQAPKDGWRLVTSVFSAGPSLATLWFGDGAIQSIRNVKGATHPARCAGSTVRGRFWCDNAVANLVHVSDDAAEVARELGVLRSVEPDLFAGPLSTRGLAPFRDPGPPTPRHSGILTLCSVVTALLEQQGSALPRLDLPDGGDARETMARAEAWLRETRASTPPGIAAAVESYLDGTAQPSDFLRALRGAAPVSRWQELILRCGILSRPEWLELAGTG
jgi:nucleoside diphosphate kinase